MKHEDLQEALAWDDPWEVMLALQGLLEHQFGDSVILDPAPLTPTQKVVVLIQEMDAQVENGGFHQYFTNYGGGLALEALDALREIGATQTEQLLEQAIAVFPSSKPPRDRDERDRLLRAMGENVDEKLEILSQQYYRQDESVHALATEYIKQRLDDFYTED